MFLCCFDKSSLRSCYNHVLQQHNEGSSSPTEAEVSPLLIYCTMPDSRSAKQRKELMQSATVFVTAENFINETAYSRNDGINSKRLTLAIHLASIVLNDRLVHTPCGTKQGDVSKTIEKCALKSPHTWECSWDLWSNIQLISVGSSLTSIHNIYAASAPNNT